MGKLTKLSILIVIFVLLAWLISGSRSQFFKQVDNNLNSSEKLGDGAKAPQTFGRGFANSNAEKLGEVANPNYKISFPKDHYSHDSFDIEWWYLTANLQDDAGNDYGLQWTLFRFRNPNIEATDWNNEHIYMAHASVHSDSKHWFSEKFARGDVGNAGNVRNTGNEQSPFTLFIDDWRWSGATAGLLPATLNFNAKLISYNTDHAENSNLHVQLNLSNTGPYVLQGKNGYSIKSANGKHASHYYGAPFIEVNGSFTLNETASITSTLNKQIAVQGKAWFDQEWTSQLFDQATLGWDWLSLHLDNGDKIMAFRMRLKDQPDYITGTYIESDGATTPLMPTDIILNPVGLTEVGKKQLPLSWQLKIKSKDIDIHVKTSKNDQWNPASIAYYEGTVAISGTHKGKGFLELTGY